MSHSTPQNAVFTPCGRALSCASCAMNLITVHHDIRLLTVRATSFPAGVPDAFARVTSRSSRRRAPILYGISKPDRHGVIRYQAGLEATSSRQQGPPGWRVRVLRKGVYATVTVRGWRKRLDTISGVFASLLRHPQCDPASPCIEVYRSPSVLVCMIRLTSS